MWIMLIKYVEMVYPRNLYNCLVTVLPYSNSNVFATECNNHNTIWHMWYISQYHTHAIPELKSYNSGTLYSGVSLSNRPLQGLVFKFVYKTQPVDWVQGMNLLTWIMIFSVIIILFEKKLKKIRNKYKS